MTGHYSWCDPPRCTPPVHRSRVVDLNSQGVKVPLHLRCHEDSISGPLVVFGDPRGPFLVRLSTLKLAIAELESLMQPRVAEVGER